MKRIHGKPIEIEVYVNYLSSEPPIRAITFSPPPPADDRCFVKNFQELWIHPGHGHDHFPVYLRFRSRVSITAVGFARIGGPEPSPHRKKGHCGGCFVLEDDIDPATPATLLIENRGPGTREGRGYRFKLWFEDPDREVDAIDPQIYNQGVGGEPG